MLLQTKDRKGIESHEYTEFRTIVKDNGTDVMKRFRNRYRELKVEPNRGKAIETNYMGSQSESRKRFHDKRQRSQSRDRGYFHDKRRREDSQGRGYFRAYSRDRSGFYRNDRSQSRNRGYSRDNRGRSVSRNNDKRENRENKSKSRERSQEVYKRCIACRCENCLKLREKAMGVNLCEGFEMKEELLVHFTEKGKRMMI